MRLRKYCNCFCELSKYVYAMYICTNDTVWKRCVLKGAKLNSWAEFIRRFGIFCCRPLK